MSFKNLIFKSPLLWNTRVFQILGFLLLLNTLFFVLGYNYFQNISQIFNSDFEDFFDEIIVYLMGVLILFITLVIWLFYYLRNNAFKSFYPVKISYLRQEASIIFIIFIFMTSIFPMYNFGKTLKNKHLVANLKEDEIEDIVEMAHCFIPYDIEQFEINRCCDSVNARLRRESVTTYESKTRCDNDYPYSNDVALTDTTYTREATTFQEPKYYSYLYYCNDAAPNVLFKGSNYSSIAKKWLLNKKKDSIKMVLDQYLTIAGSLNINCNLNIDHLANNCFKDSNFSIQETFNPYFESKYTNGSAEYYDIQNIASRIRGIKESDYFETISLIAIVYVSLGLSIVLLGFRFTRFKPWIVSVIGSGVVVILFVIVVNIVNSDELMQYLYILFILACFSLALYKIKHKQNKLHAGIWLQWFSFGFGAILPLVFGMIHEKTGELRSCINNYWVVTRKELPIHTWISDHWNTINSMNFMLIALIFLYVIIPLMYRWQSNPSE